VGAALEARLHVLTTSPLLPTYMRTRPQGRVRHRLAHKVEFCYAPTLSEISVSKSAIYATGMQPGTTAWSFAKSVALPAPYNDGRAVMFNGDSVDATWTLQANKYGADVNYQGVVSGTITINNPTPAVITVNSIIDQITGGPAATVTCPVGTPFTVPACSFATCQYTAYYPTAPPPGTYTSAAQVQFQVMGSQGYPSMVQGATVFNTGLVGGAGFATSAATIPVGAAMVTDPQAPQSSYMFTGPGQQSFQTSVTCGGASASGALSNTAVLTGANGQQVTQSATLQKQCYDLAVTVVSKASPFVGRWGWSVTKTASPSALNLRPESKGTGYGSDYATTTTGDVVYTVTYTRNPPAGFVAGVPAFEAAGDVIVQNSAPINAKLQSVLVSISNSRGGQPHVVEASCPMLLIPAGQKVVCSWRANPTFNPVGAAVRGIARYVNLRNGEPNGGTTDFTSAPATIGGGDAEGPSPYANVTAGHRHLLQTWGGAAHETTIGLPAELEAGPAPAVATTLYNADGSAMVVPNMVASGDGVIVSGGRIEPTSATPVLALSHGTPVVLPGGLGGHGYQNEAGPNGAAAAASSLSGLQDECADVADTFVTDGGAVEGQLISGAMPSGRICSTTTFTYTMRYGPYGDCAARKSVNAATFQAVDTQTRGSSQSDITIAVDGCVNPSALKISPGKLATIAKGGYGWTVTKRADQKDLVIGQDATATVTYTVEYKRVGAKAGSSVASDVYLSNPSDFPIPVQAATYTATTMCNEQARTTSGPITCDGESVPAGGKIACRVNAGIPCTGHGAYTVVITSSNGYTITSAPTPFAFNSTQVAVANTGECADVRDSFQAGSGNAGGAVVSGTRPNGRLCGSKTFTYTVKFGPYTECTTLQVGTQAPATEAPAGCCRLHHHPACSCPSSSHPAGGLTHPSPACCLLLLPFTGREHCNPHLRWPDPQDCCHQHAADQCGGLRPVQACSGHEDRGLRAPAQVVEGLRRVRR
jgi:hypothetical protein